MVIHRNRTRSDWRNFRTVVALQMFFVWPGILEFGGEAVGVGFMWEGYAFLLEGYFSHTMSRHGTK